MKKEIRRSACEKCAGVGKLPTEVSVECHKCSGRGWYGKTNQEAICESCLGTGAIRKVVDSQCKNCEGRGHLIRIVEIKKLRRKCRHCPDNDAVEEQDCATCSGSGYDPDFQTCGACQGSCTYRGWPCSHCSSTGVVSLAKAKSNQNLHYIQNLGCNSCGGGGKVELPAQCRVCGGTGYVSELVENDVTPK